MVMNELRARGVGDILIAVVDSLKSRCDHGGIPDTVVQTRIVHRIRHSIQLECCERGTRCSRRFSSVRPGPSTRLLRDRRLAWRPVYSNAMTSACLTSRKPHNSMIKPLAVLVQRATKLRWTQGPAPTPYYCKATQTRLHKSVAGANSIFVRATMSTSAVPSVPAAFWHECLGTAVIPNRNTGISIICGISRV